MTTRELILSYLSSLETRAARGAIKHGTKVTYTQGVKTYAKLTGVDAPVSTKTFIKFLKVVQGSKSSVLTWKSAVIDFYKFCHSEHAIQIDLIELQDATHRYAPHIGERLPEFDQESVEKLISHAEGLTGSLINLRNRAMIVTIADSGLRAFEACGLKVKDIDWENSRAVLIGKGDKQAVVRFSTRALQYIREYLDARSGLDAVYQRPADLPLFARHDKRAGKKILPFGTGSLWSTVKSVGEAAGVDVDKVWTHALRHRFVTEILKKTGNLKIAQVQARHANIQVTQRYAHLSDKDLNESFVEVFG